MPTWRAINKPSPEDDYQQSPSQQAIHDLPTMDGSGDTMSEQASPPFESLSQINSDPVEHDTTIQKESDIMSVPPSAPAAQHDQTGEDDKGSAQSSEPTQSENGLIDPFKGQNIVQVNRSPAPVGNGPLSKKDKKSTKTIDVDEADNEQINHPGHLELNRHKFAVCGPNVPPGQKVTGRVIIEGTDNAYWQWPLYNDFKPIDKKDPASWPPAYVNLQDWHVLEILRADISKAKCRENWPADFAAHGEVQQKRKPRGRAGKVQYKGRFHYAVVCGTYQLSGDEASQAVVHIPANLDVPENQARNVIGTGQFCEIQEDFKPSEPELQRGTLMDRIDEATLKNRPLNNRNDWGPENRTGLVPNKVTKSGKRTKNVVATPKQGSRASFQTLEQCDDEEGEVEEDAASVVSSSRKRPASNLSKSRKSAKKLKSDAPTTSSGKSSPSADLISKSKKKATEETEDDQTVKMENASIVLAQVSSRPAATANSFADIEAYLQSSIETLKRCIGDLAKSGCHLMKKSTSGLISGTLNPLQQNIKEAFDSLGDTESFQKMSSYLVFIIKLLHCCIGQLIQSYDVDVRRASQTAATQGLDSFEKYTQEFFSGLVDREA